MTPTVLPTNIELHRFSDLFDKYSPAIYGRILNVVKNRGLADKILERVFVNTWKNRSSNNTQVSEFTQLLNETRKSTYHIVKSVKFFNAFSCGGCIELSAI